MRAITITAPGGPDVLVPKDMPDPEPGFGEVRIRVHAAGVNRPDVLQRMGRYAPPPGASEIPGLEVSGVIDAVGPGVTLRTVGERVCALLNGGGYAELALAREGHCLPLADHVSFTDGAATPETWFTVWANVFEQGALEPGQTLLVHAGSSGIGHTALQLAKARGSKVMTTSRTEEKAEFCRSLGADRSLVVPPDDFVAAAKELTDNKGVDVVLDMVAGETLPRNLEALAFRGRVVFIAFLAGAKPQLPVPVLMKKQAILTGSFLRSRSDEEKTRLAQRVEAELLPLLSQGAVKPHVACALPLARASEAHRLMESGELFGKVVLEA